MFVLDKVEFLFELGLLVAFQRDHHIGLVGLLGISWGVPPFDIFELLPEKSKYNYT